MKKHIQIAAFTSILICSGAAFFGLSSAWELAQANKPGGDPPTETALHEPHVLGMHNVKELGDLVGTPDGVEGSLESGGGLGVIGMIPISYSEPVAKGYSYSYMNNGRRTILNYEVSESPPNTNTMLASYWSFTTAYEIASVDLILKDTVCLSGLDTQNRLILEFWTFTPREGGYEAGEYVYPAGAQGFQPGFRVAPQVYGSASFIPPADRLGPLVPARKEFFREDVGVNPKWATPYPSGNTVLVLGEDMNGSGLTKVIKVQKSGSSTVATAVTDSSAWPWLPHSQGMALYFVKDTPGFIIAFIGGFEDDGLGGEIEYDEILVAQDFDGDESIDQWVLFRTEVEFWAAFATQVLPRVGPIFSR